LADEAREELDRRLGMWETLQQRFGTEAVAPKHVSDLQIYRGGTGVWVDLGRTAGLADGEAGVTVAILHTGTSYADDLFDDGLLYHYPHTKRPPTRDAMEVESTKNAGRLALPIFVLIGPPRKAKNVCLGWVEDWSDEEELFVVAFGEQPPTAPPPESQRPLKLVTRRKHRRELRPTRPGQRRFKFSVLRRYGRRCAVCGITSEVLLDAVHVVPWAKGGADDPRNGLMLCALHHRAFDAGLFTVHPDTLALHYDPSGPDAPSLFIEVDALSPMRSQPAREALKWVWDRWHD